MRKNLIIVLLFPFLATACFKTRDDIAREKEETEVRSSLQQNIVESHQSLERLQADIGHLQGKMEELEHQRKKEMTGFTSTFASKSENGQKAMEELQAKVSSLQQGQNALFEEIKRLKEDNLQLEKTLAERSAAPSATGGGGVKKKGAVVTNSFETALSAYKAKDYQGAIQGFRAFVATSPKSKKLLDARFFLGDSLYKSKAFAEAVVEFGVIHEKAASTPLGRKATLRIAQSFRAMGKEKDAKAFAQILVQTSPESEEAKKAQVMLK